MAMNKKEAAELAEAKQAARINRALRWTDPVSRDLPPPQRGIGGLYVITNGYDINSHASVPNAYKAWSSAVSNGNGHAINGERPKYASQNSRTLYSTRLLALRALRSELEMRYAKTLADIDAEIDAEAAAQSLA